MSVTGGADPARSSVTCATALVTRGNQDDLWGNGREQMMEGR